MGKNKVLICEEKYGFYIHSVIGMNSEYISKFKCELLEYTKAPEDMKKLAQAIKNVLHNGTYRWLENHNLTPYFVCFEYTLF